MGKTLIITTNSFPFGRNEDQLLFQVDFFSKVYDKVLIISFSNSNSIQFDLPNNVEVFRFETKVNFILKILGGLYLFNKHYFNELIYIFLRKKSKLKCLKVMNNSFVISKRFSNFINRIVNQTNENYKDLTFYSYWATEAAIGSNLYSLKKNGVKSRVFVRFHAYDLYEERHLPNYIPFRDFLKESSKKLIFISDQGKTYFISKYNGINNSITNRLGVIGNEHLELKVDTNCLKIVSCSSLINLKRVNKIIEALSLIDSIKIKWFHIGTGILYDDLLSLAKIKLQNKENVDFEFVGFIENQKLKEFYLKHNFDLLINTSKYEGIPISMMEALSFSVPCVGTNVGGVSEIIKNNYNGFLLERDFEIEKLKDVLINYFELNFEEKKNLRSNAYNFWKKNYNANSNTLKLIDILNLKM